MMKLYQKSLLIIVVITLVGTGCYFGWNWLHAPHKAKAKTVVTIDDLLNESVDTDSITTNFADSGYIQAKFKLITTSPNNADEVKKRQFQVQSTIITYINSLKKADASGQEGFTKMEDTLKTLLNKALGANYITRVYTVDKLIQ